jgi:uncharacterized protein YdhG (YjbR/CyaY superfamily)
VAPTFATIDDYISSFPADVRVVLADLRATIRRAAPGAEETISYQMPTITLDGRHLVYFAAWKHHLGLYPVPTTDEALERELAPYRAAKSTVRFPLGQALPHDLIERVVAVLVRRRTDGAG